MFRWTSDARVQIKSGRAGSQEEPYDEFEFSVQRVRSLIDWEPTASPDGAEWEQVERAAPQFRGGMMVNTTMVNAMAGGTVIRIALCREAFEFVQRWTAADRKTLSGLERKALAAEAGLLCCSLRGAKTNQAVVNRLSGFFPGRREQPLSAAAEEPAAEEPAAAEEVAQEQQEQTRLLLSDLRRLWDTDRPMVGTPGTDDVLEKAYRSLSGLLEQAGLSDTRCHARLTLELRMHCVLRHLDQLGEEGATRAKKALAEQFPEGVASDAQCKRMRAELVKAPHSPPLCPAPDGAMGDTPAQKNESARQLDGTAGRSNGNRTDWAFRMGRASVR